MPALFFGHCENCESGFPTVYTSRTGRKLCVSCAIEEIEDRIAQFPQYYAEAILTQDTEDYGELMVLESVLLDELKRMSSIANQ